MTLETSLDHLGSIVAVLSALASLLNHVIRQKQAKGEEVSKLLLGAGAVLNTGAVNLDKAVQLGKQLKTGKATDASAPAKAQE